MILSPSMQSAPRPVARFLRLHLSRRTFSLRAPLAAAPPFRSGPAPPRLPKEEQEVFEQLQRQSTGAFSSSGPQQQQQNQSTDKASSQQQQSQQSDPPSTKEQMLEILRARARVTADGKGEELHPHVRRGAQVEFEGERNPKTGEVGGPKNDPLRWGDGGDWSYNGRVTDF